MGDGAPASGDGLAFFREKNWRLQMQRQNVFLTRWTAYRTMSNGFLNRL